ncbi:MAG: hypothetical protein U5K43_10840 [Halofilum sp. (in: g-proteobacteria)]|nr:hypothetical protein [Halofilum sp. (in: g-proteobacteria)]
MSMPADADTRAGELLAIVADVAAELHPGRRRPNAGARQRPRARCRASTASAASRSCCACSRALGCACPTTRR